MKRNHHLSRQARDTQHTRKKMHFQSLSLSYIMYAQWGNASIPEMNRCDGGWRARQPGLLRSHPMLFAPTQVSNKTTGLKLSSH